MAGNPFDSYGDAVDQAPTSPATTNPFSTLGDPVDPASAAPSDNPFNQFGDPVPAGAPPADGSSASTAAANATVDPMQEVVVSAKRTPADQQGPTSWGGVMSGILPTIGAKMQSRYAGAEEYLGTDEYKDARTKLWQSMVLPQAVKEAKDAGIALTELPYVQDTAKRLGVRVDQFTKDWPDYEDMKPEEQEAFYQKQVQRIQEGQEQAGKGQALRESASTTQNKYAPSDALSGWSPKKIVASTLTGVPDLLAGMAVGAAGTAAGGPAVGAGAATAYFVGTAAPEEYADARNQGADHDTATTYAALSALANAVPEIPVVKAVTDGGMGQKLIAKATTDAFADSLPGRMVNTAASQALAQTVITGAQQAIDHGVMDKDISLSEALTQMAQSALVGGLSGAPLGAMHGGSHAPAPTSEAPKIDMPASGAAQPTESPEAAATSGKPIVDPEKTLAALQAVVDKSVDPAQAEHLENLGYVRRNDVGAPMMLPAGRRALMDLQKSHTDEGAAPTQVPESTAETRNSPTGESPTFEEQLAKARTDTNPEPTKEEQSSGNYAKGELPYAGMTMVIENAKGSTRQGKDWNQKMANDYGYLKDIPGYDGDELDAFLTGKPDTGKVFVATQVDPKTGKFDEHKVVLGADSQKEAMKVYKDNYPADWQGFKSMYSMTTAEFKERAEAGMFAPKPEAPKAQNTDQAENAQVGQIFRIPPAGIDESGAHAGERARVLSIFRHGDDQPWKARLSLEGGGQAAVELPHNLESTEQAQPKAKAGTPDPQNDSALQYLAKSGGVNMKEAEAEGFDKADLATPRSGIRRAFHSKGMSIDTAGEKLRDAGYDVMSPGADGEPTMDRDKVMALFDKELRGTPQYSNRHSMENVDRRAADEAAHRAQVEKEATQHIPDWHEQPEDIKSITALADLANRHDPDAVERALEHEDDEEVRQRLREIIRRGQEDEGQARQGQEQPETVGVRQEEEGLLATQTEGELTERERVAAAAKKAEAAAAKQAKDRADADRAAKDFRLTGSDRKADEEMAGGQGSLFQYQTQLFGPGGESATGSRAEKTEGAAKSAPERAPQVQVFVNQKSDRNIVHTKLQEVGTFRTGIKQVNRWQDAAHIFAPLRKSPQESMMALALDKDGKPLTILRHSIGGPGNADAIPHLIMGALTKIDGVDHVYFAHNHPAGEPSQSPADLIITDKLHGLMRGSGIEPMGMIVVSPGNLKASFYRSEMGQSEGSIHGDITQRARNKGAVPVVERRFQRVASNAEKGEPIGTYDQAVEAVKKTGNKSGLLMVNQRGYVVGHLPLTGDEMAKLRTGSKDSGVLHVARALEDANASAVISFGQRADYTGIRNLSTFLGTMGLRHMDTIIKPPGKDWESMGGGAPTHHKDVFYSRNGGTGMDRDDLERTVRKTIRDSGMRAAPDFPHVEVHQDFTTLPPDLRDRVIEDGAQYTAGALYDPETGRIHMLADNLGSEKEAQETLWHEAVGHHGLSLIMDADRYGHTMDGIWNAMPDRVRETAERNGLDVDNLQQRRMAAEEVVAYAAGQHLAGTAIDKPLRAMWNRVVQAVRGFFARVTGKPFTSDNDIAKLIGESKRAIETGATQQRISDIAKSTRAPTFHSAVERAVEASKQAKASADQWLATLRKTPGVKAEEMQWLGVEDWLKAQQGAVSKSDLQDFIKANQLHLEETVHGATEDEQSPAQRKQTELAEQLRADGYHVTFSELGELSTIRHPDTSELSGLSMDAEDPHAFEGLSDKHQEIVEELQKVSMSVANEALARMHQNDLVPRGWDRIDPQTTRYEDYTLPGGKNYREMLIRKPAAEHISRFNVRNPNGSVEWEQHATREAAEAAAGRIGGTVEPIGSSDTNQENYRSGHWPEPNILAHVRFKDRTDADGKKVLFLEELQSDWHQAGRKHGYKNPDDAERKEQFQKVANEALGGAREEMRRMGNLGWDHSMDALQALSETYAKGENWRQQFGIDPDEQLPATERLLAARKEWHAAARRIASAPPDAPFKTTWPSLIMKRMIRQAAEGGYDRIAWTTGEQQNARYGSPSPERLAGMKGFYDDILPRETGKLVGKFGSKVEDSKVNGGTFTARSLNEVLGHYGLSREAWDELGADEQEKMFQQYEDKKSNPTFDAHGFDVTPQLREAALSQGFPMYWKKPSQQQLALQQGKGPGWYERVRNAVEHLVRNPLTDDFRKFLAPTTMDEESRRTARLATSALGNLAHNTFETQHALEAFSRQVDKLKPEEQLEMMDAIERGVPQPNAELQPIANEMRKQLDVNRDKVRALGIGALDNFIENYFPHYWADPDEAKRMMATIMGRRPLRGPASFLKMRTIPTIKEGMDAGLTPLTINPLALTLLKVREMQRFVTGVKMMQDLKDANLAQFLPSTKSMPQGWVPINDNSAKVRQWSEEEHGFIERGQYIMPEGAGRLINNHVGRSALADFMPLHAMRLGSNVLNSLQLGFSAFHLGFTTLDAMISKNALAIERLVHGEPGRAAQALLEGTTPIGAAMNFNRGLELMRAYANPAGATPEMAKVVQALTAGGGRVAMDRYYLAVQGASPFHGAGISSLAGDVRTALKGPAPLKDAAGAVARFPAEYGLKLYRGLQDLVRTTPKLQIPFELAGRIARAGSSVIMEHIVPMQKLGVFSDMAQDFLRRNPGATDDQLAGAMQKAWASVDNRLGEMVYDNLFWNRTLKDSFHLSVRAVGWNLGTIREIGGAAPDVIKAIDTLATTGKLTGDDIGHKIPYVLAMTMTTAMLGATLTYMFTGKGPQQLKDYFFPPTGGTTSHGTPERVSMPSYMKDIYEYSQRPGQTVVNKLNPLFGIIGDLYSNQDFFGDPISDPDGSTAEQLGEKAKFVGTEAMPFSVQGTKQIAGSDANDAMGKLKRVMPFVGITPAPGYITSPDQVDRMQKMQQEQKYSSELKYKLGKAAQAGDQDKVKDLQDQYIQSRKRLMQLQQGVKVDKAKAAQARHKNATSMRQQGYPATASLIDSLPLDMDQEARSYFARIAGGA